MPARGNSYQRRRFGTRPEKHPVSLCSSPNPHGPRRGEHAEVDLLGVFEFVSGVVRLMGTLLLGIASLIFWATQTCLASPVDKPKPESIRFASQHILRHQWIAYRCGRFRMDEQGGFRAHHKYMIAAIGVIAVLAFLYNLGIFDVWSVERAAK